MLDAMYGSARGCEVDRQSWLAGRCSHVQCSPTDALEWAAAFSRARLAEAGRCLGWCNRRLKATGQPFRERCRFLFAERTIRGRCVRRTCRRATQAQEIHSQQKGNPGVCKFYAAATLLQSHDPHAGTRSTRYSRDPRSSPRCQRRGMRAWRERIKISSVGERQTCTRYIPAKRVKGL